MSGTLSIALAWCGSVSVGGGLLGGLFLAGLAGSPLHCAPMCGGFVLGQVADRMARMPVHALCEWRRIGAAAIVPYHLGRLTTYAVLGAVAGLGGAAFTGVPWLSRLPAVLLLLAAALFITQALKRLLPGGALPGLDHALPGWSRALARVTRGIDRSSVPGGYLLGVALGFLPCGFLYGALIAAASYASPLAGALGMLAFGLGTVPALLAVGLGGQMAGRYWQRGVARLAPAVMLLNAALLCVMALRGMV